MQRLIQYIRPMLVMFIFLTLLCGALYPAIVTVVAQTAFPLQANGSLIERHGKSVGSALIGQSFTKSEYLWGRPSATAPVAYNAAASTGSNLSNSNKDLLDAINARVEMLRATDPANTAPIPVDLVTASGSGLDPHISPGAADYQVNRIAKARQISEEAVREVIAIHTDSRLFGMLGEPVVNVLEVNLALDGIQAETP